MQMEKLLAKNITACKCFVQYLDNLVVEGHSLKSILAEVLALAVGGALVIILPFLPFYGRCGPVARTFVYPTAVNGS